MVMKDDAEVSALNEEFAGNWHITRRPTGDLDAAREPGRGYHVVETHALAMRATLSYIDRNGGRLLR
jgi:hypothetical protein